MIWKMFDQALELGIFFADPITCFSAVYEGAEVTEHG